VTREFDGFMKQLGAKGYQKGQGFNLQAVKRLSSAERERAEDLLVTAVEAGDTTAIPALGALGSRRAEETLRRQYAATDSPGYKHAVLASALWHTTADEGFREALFSDLASVQEEHDRLAILTMTIQTQPSRQFVPSYFSIVEHDSRGLGAPPK